MNQPATTVDMAERSGLTARRVQLYCAAGIFGDHNRAPGGGRQRTFTDDDLYVAVVLQRVSQLAGAIAGHNPQLDPVVAATVAAEVRARPDGRWLAVRFDGECTVHTIDKGEALTVGDAVVALVDLEALRSKVGW